ncbi:MAG: ABC transporter permease [Prevotella sp.]|nr:ABC transporter permease [Staphylococcus sp.]MCM1350532.1 ABC transporter permease [Prevotella sp.]
MSKVRVLAKRNRKEILRDPLSLVFNFVFPVLMLLLFFCFLFEKTEVEIKTQVSMFHPYKLIPAIAIFAHSFLSLFSGMMIAKDRSESFFSRLCISPLKPYQFCLGYFLPLLEIAFFQSLIVYGMGSIMSLFTSVSFHLFSIDVIGSFIVGLFFSSFFISFGLCMGLLVSDKAVGGVASLGINLTAIGSGMFMPLATIPVLKQVVQFLPFYHMVTFVQDVARGFYPASLASFQSEIELNEALGISVLYNGLDIWWVHICVAMIYIIILLGCTWMVFYKKIQSH